MNTKQNQLIEAKNELLRLCKAWRTTRNEFQHAANCQGIPIEEVRHWYETEEDAALGIMEAAMDFALLEGGAS